MQNASLEQLSKAELISLNVELRGEVEELKHQLHQLTRMIFGARSERFVPAVPNEQLSLGLDTAPTPLPEVVKEDISYSRAKKKTGQVPTGRQPLPAHLERRRILIEPEQDITGLQCIGEEVTEQMEYEPGKLFVLQYVRRKYARPLPEGKTSVLIGRLPAFPIEKGIPGPGLLSHIIIDKFCDHLPVYRQIKRYERQGVKLNGSTICGWLETACDLLSPLYEALKARVLASGYIQGDETPIQVMDKEGKGSTHTGYHWVYHTPAERLVLFDYREGRGREGPREMLKDYTGYLQTDGYGVYEDKQIGAKAGITLLHCMAHTRRYFEKSLDNDKARAEYFLEEVQKLYAIERRCREENLSVEQITALRQEQAVPVLEELHKWLQENYHQVLPKSAIGKAIAYALPRWEKLSLYVTGAQLQIDNNLIENSIRPVALGRKNYLFAGSHEGARRAALIYSLIGSCKRQEVNPYLYMRDILTRIASHPINQISDLLPGSH